jgi:hypothetical protein
MQIRGLVDGDNPHLVVFVRTNGDLSQISQCITWDSDMDEASCPPHLTRLTHYLEGQLRIYPNAPRYDLSSATSEPESGLITTVTPSPNTRAPSSQPAHPSPTSEETILPNPEDSDHGFSTGSNLVTSQEEEEGSDLIPTLNPKTLTNLPTLSP